MRAQPLALAGAFALVACQSTTPTQDDDVLLEIESAPTEAVAASAPAFDVDGDHESVWSYLVERYDTDGDGAISAAEYERDGQGFGRLDRNGDGTLTEADMVVDRQAMMRGMMAQMLVAMYFQADDDPEKLSLEELEEAFDAYDANGDGVVTAEEFEALSGAREPLGAPPPEMVADRLSRMDPFEALAGGLGVDPEEGLSREGLSAFFTRRDDGDGVWDLGGNDRAAANDDSGALEGSSAPDFELEPYGGGELVRLSSFAGKQPVALVFGSYT